MKGPAHVQLVIDTSYLLELYKVPHRSDPKHFKPIHDLFDRAVAKEHSRFVPFPVIFEVANHIAHVKDGEERRTLAKRFVADVNSGIESPAFFTIIAQGGGKVLHDLDTLFALCEKYRDEFVHRGIGLTDTTIITEAQRLKDKHRSHGYRVHIWTLDGALKAHEPDSEPDGYVKSV